MAYLPKETFSSKSYKRNSSRYYDNYYYKMYGGVAQDLVNHADADITASLTALEADADARDLITAQYDLLRAIPQVPDGDLALPYPTPGNPTGQAITAAITAGVAKVDLKNANMLKLLNWALNVSAGDAANNVGPAKKEIVKRVMLIQAAQMAADATIIAARDQTIVARDQTIRDKDALIAGEPARIKAAEDQKEKDTLAALKGALDGMEAQRDDFEQEKIKAEAALKTVRQEVTELQGKVATAEGKVAQRNQDMLQLADRVAGLERDLEAEKAKPKASEPKAPEAKPTTDLTVEEMIAAAKAKLGGSESKVETPDPRTPTTTTSTSSLTADFLAKYSSGNQRTRRGPDS